MAVEAWASVELSVDTPCKNVPEIGSPKGKDLTYLSFEDNIVFNNYWPWTSEIYDKLIVYDKRGMVLKTLPCPNVLTQLEIAEMRATVSAVSGSNITNAEKRVLSRIVERLSRVDGRSLSSFQDGCSDWHDGDDVRPKSTNGQESCFLGTNERT
jgi:hypothetical protein